MMKVNRLLKFLQCATRKTWFLWSNGFLVTNKVKEIVSEDEKGLNNNKLLAD